jgi:hypothetical protein
MEILLLLFFIFISYTTRSGNHFHSFSKNILKSFLCFLNSKLPTCYLGKRIFLMNPMIHGNGRLNTYLSSA